MELEVALEATTGSRVVTEDLQRVGAVVHLAEPAPDLWIAPDHILDLRARVPGAPHALSHQRGERQERIQTVLYHHGCPHAAS